MRGSRGGTGGSEPPPPLENQKIYFFSNSGPGTLKNHKATNPEFIVGPSSARQRNAIRMAFCWRADVGPILVVFGSTHQIKINIVKVGPPLKKLSRYAHECLGSNSL